MYLQYLDSARRQFQQYKRLADNTFPQLTDDQLFWQYNEESNSIAVIVKHLWGNMLSRWTDFLTTDGEKEWRARDAEFENDIKNRTELLHKWEEGWNCLFAALAPLREEDLGRTIYIRKEPHTVMEAINRQLTHYASHVGQIIFIGKMLAGSKWQSLSIPRGQSKQFNQEMYSRQK